ncbi:hypothetical protein KSP39_PZI009674 [Platanthera zijinensis]|uniref:Uncharacterized protein n=1 Tax=Platanthera zijinensis TaxID=2320716 RepID=A0AAP0G7V7_9ASPA
MASEMRRIRNAAKSRSAPPPTWMRREIFEGLWDIWEACKFKDLQESNRKNRLSDRGGQGVVKSTGHFSAPGPGYFSTAAPGYYTSHGYFPVPSQHPHAQYQVESQAHASTQRQPFENHHSSDTQITQS